MTYLDIAPGGGRVREVPGDRVVKADLALLNQRQDRSGRENLADRPDLVAGLWRVGQAAFDVGVTVPRPVLNYPARDRENGSMEAPLANKPIEAWSDGGLGNGRAPHRGCGQARPDKESAVDHSSSPFQSPDKSS